MELFERALGIIQENKDKVINGGVNSIPHNFTRFRGDFPGIEQKTYFQVTASTKVGKSQITDDLFVHTPIKYAFNNPDKIRLRIFYFTLEMSAEQKAIQIMSHILWNMSGFGIRADPKKLRSVDSSQPLPQEVIDLLKSEDYRRLFEYYESHIEFIDSIKNPYGIFKFMQEYAKSHGTQHRKIIKYRDKTTGKFIETEVDSYYEPDDPDEYVIIIVDHMALLSPEGKGTIRDAMVKLSSDHFVALRNKYRYIPVAVVQQMAAQESNENAKLNKLKPTLDGYGEAKIISRDADVIIGLFSPFRHAIDTYEKYDIRLFRDNIRFLEIIAGREGGGGNVCPLFFDGGVNYFQELPLPDDIAGLSEAKILLSRIRNNKIIDKPLIQFNK